MELHKSSQKLNKRGIVGAVKSFLFGDANDNGIEQNNDGQYFYDLVSSSHSFGRRNLKYLIETGYSSNPIVFGIIQKISLSQSNIVCKPYWKGKPYVSKTWDFDLVSATQMLLTSGNLFIWNKEIVGMGRKMQVLNTLNISPFKIGGKWQYNYIDDSGYSLNIPEQDLIHIYIFDIGQYRFTGLGLSPLQVAIMPLEAMKQMYIADTSILKNKGRDILITNDTDTPLVEDENRTNDEVLNERLSGAMKSGGVATSNAKLRVQNLGRTAKELALWEGYKIKARDICMVLQFPSSLANDPDGKTYANFGESSKALYTECVIPFTRLITDNTDFKSALGYEVFLDLSQIEVLQESQATRFEKNTTITDAIVGLNQNVKAGDITRDIAVSLLVNEWDYDQEEAGKMIIQEPKTNIQQATI